MPTKQEIWKAIIQLKNGKAAGPDDTPAEALKVYTDTYVEKFYPLFLTIFAQKRGAGGMEEGIPHQASKEGRSQSVFKQQGNNITVHLW